MSTTTPRTRTAVSCTLLVTALGAGVTACGSDGNPLAANPYDAADEISFNGPTDAGKKADPDKPLEVTTKDSDGRITDVTAVDTAGRYVSGELDADGTRWHSTSPLAAGDHYTVRVSTEDGDGAPGRKVLAFDTSRPQSQKRLNVTFGPDAGAYGVGQPITATLDQPVRDKAERAVVERGLQVESTPAVDGSWYWVDDKHLHYRPQDYWPANATIDVYSNLENIRISDRLWGGSAKPLTITTGDRIIAVTDAATHQMAVWKNNQMIKQIPVTTGKPGFDTRNGVKVVLAKQYFVRMKSSTVGIADFYDLPVYYAARVTWSGEYVHAAPWSVGSQGYANVSHGCTGMSTANAQWFFKTIHEGDIVQVVNSKGQPMEPFSNGFGDWNIPWQKWVLGSALTAAGTPDTTPQAVQARLRPQGL
ncbi:Ig-like domain-containing protein [Streptomyces sp. Li-HN-5-11]|uniref:L,D-transpeptidase n=1 Tax=Streptomyces sp. Li-HN-5-11 TaxID=3075432 RepID=UPI0028A8C8CF|nr:Ig-like domain-containing protein [Streptomyces sp. Li-HN-5-11]WNM34600.1 Ig-like domain-containing protein [Streptomyces sp. Li-HN-5-11]